MITRCMFALAGALSAGMALAQAKPENLEKAAEVAKLCLEELPNVKAVVTGLKDLGLRAEDLDGPFQFYSFDTYRLVVGVPRAGKKEWGCIVGVSKMTAKEGKSLAQIWVKGSGAKEQALTDQDRADDVAAGWIGKFPAGAVDIGVIVNQDWGIFKGTAIGALRSKS